MDSRALTVPRVSPRRRAKRLSLRARKTLAPERFCARERCYRAPAHLGRCASHATEHLDKLWSIAVRARGACEVCGATENLQAAHGLSRRYRATRWMLINGFALCRGCHVSMTHRPLEWDACLRVAWGDATYDELRRLALVGEVDYLAALKGLAEAA